MIVRRDDASRAYFTEYMSRDYDTAQRRTTEEGSRAAPLETSRTPAFSFYAQAFVLWLHKQLAACSRGISTRWGAQAHRFKPIRRASDARRLLETGRSVRRLLKHGGQRQRQHGEEPVRTRHWREDCVRTLLASRVVARHRSRGGTVGTTRNRRGGQAHDEGWRLPELEP